MRGPRAGTTAEQLGRQLRLAPLDEPGPDIAEATLAQVVLPDRGRWRRPLQIALITTAVAQLLIGLAAVFGPVGIHMPTTGGTTHINHEAAFNLAFGVRLLIVGINTRAARHQVPVLASLVSLLAVSSAFDLANGIINGQRLATHVLLVAGLMLAMALRRGPHPGQGPEHVDGLLPYPDARRARELPGSAAQEYGTPPPATHRQAA